MSTENNKRKDCPSDEKPRPKRVHFESDDEEEEEVDVEEEGDFEDDNESASPSASEADEASDSDIEREEKASILAAKAEEARERAREKVSTRSKPEEKKPDKIIPDDDDDLDNLFTYNKKIDTEKKSVVETTQPPVKKPDDDKMTTPASKGKTIMCKWGDTLARHAIKTDDPDSQKKPKFVHEKDFVAVKQKDAKEKIFRLNGFMSGLSKLPDAIWYVEKIVEDEIAKGGEIRLVRMIPRKKKDSDKMYLAFGNQWATAKKLAFKEMHSVAVSTPDAPDPDAHYILPSTPMYMEAIDASSDKPIENLCSIALGTKKTPAKINPVFKSVKSESLNEPIERYLAKRGFPGSVTNPTKVENVPVCCRIRYEEGFEAPPRKKPAAATKSKENEPDVKLKSNPEKKPRNTEPIQYLRSIPEKKMSAEITNQACKILDAIDLDIGRKSVIIALALAQSAILPHP